MNQPGAQTFTVFHFAMIALLVVATLVVVFVGVRRKRRRRAAEQAFDEQAEQAAAAPDAPIAPSPAPPAMPAPAAPQVLARRSEPAAAPDEPPPARLADEPVAAAAPNDASPAAQVQLEPAPADGPVTQLKGLGPKVAARLADLGVTTVGQVAALDADGAQALDAQLGPFTGRLARDRWVEQARFLAAGDRAGFEAVFGRL